MPDFPLLSAIVFVPLLGGLLCLILARRPGAVRALALLTSLVDLALVLSLLPQGPPAALGTGWLRVESTPWVRALGIHYTLSLDGVSLMLSLLAALLMVLCVLISWRSVQTRVGAYHFCLLFTQTGILGVFLATDLFLFYLFWEVQIVPMFFLVGLWGHEGRLRATVKFILYTIAGSLLMLIALISLYLVHGFQTGAYTFDLAALRETALGPAAAGWMYAAFLLAFAIKIPVVPVHNWLPDAHTEAPTAGSVILAGLLLKAGTYALFRVAIPLFPGAARASAPLLLTVGLIGLFYAAWIALAQRDMKRLVAYSSIAHMGLIVIGLAVWDQVTLSGALLQMINHGLSTSALFILVGMIDERIESRRLSDVGGLWKRMPVFSAFFLLFALSAMGLPGLNNFVGEILVLVGTFQSRPFVAILGFGALVFSLAYTLRFVQRTLFGAPNDDERFTDVTPREALVLSVLALGVLFVGLHPDPVLRWFEQPIQTALGQVATAVLP